MKIKGVSAIVAIDMGVGGSEDDGKGTERVGDCDKECEIAVVSKSQ